MASSGDPRPEACLTRRIWLGGFLLALSACGGTKAGPAGPDAGVTADAPAGDGGGGATGQTGGHGAVSSGGAGGMGTTGGGGTAGTAGAGGASPQVPAVDIAGRWGLFTFEDPVGVQLRQAADGALTGEGCAAGAPGSSSSDLLVGCGPISGRVTGRTAWFAFPLQGFAITYRVDAAISADARRMTGTLSNNVAGVAAYLVALQRVRDDAGWLDRGPPTEAPPIEGHYELTLIPATSEGAEFVAGKTYRLSYWQRTISGDLRSFWNNEISPVGQGSPLRVGPVPATVPELPTTLTLDFGAAALTAVTATTASGGHYQFSAKKMTP